jgi:plasmid maintenance system antidote protein VapI
MDRLTPITLGELIDEEFLQPLGVSQYRLTKAIDVPAAPIVLRQLMTPRWPVLS